MTELATDDHGSGRIGPGAAATSPRSYRHAGSSYKLQKPDPVQVSEAEREFTEAALYYERQPPGLGADFIAAVNEAMADLRQFPYRWRLINAIVRRGLLRRFPYAFFYWEKLAGEELEILSISHSKRHPLYWIDRHE